ncbi:MAG TPA: hypothetical protein VNO33_09810, partial [Kofleriaceae bacterium]|nr:hypothetical protein [Kofleriaceae bacterium]
IERRAARGDRVQKGDVLAQLVDPSVWLVIADVTSEEISTTWSCHVSTAEGRNSAPCRIEGVQRLGAQQSRVTATAMSDAAGWLQGGGQELLLALTPPAGAADTPTASAAPPPSSTVRTSADASAEADAVESEDDPQPADSKPAAGIPALVPAAAADAGP